MIVPKKLLTTIIFFTGVTGFQLPIGNRPPVLSAMSATTPDQTLSVPNWDELKVLSGSQIVGEALNNEVKTRSNGRGSPRVQSNLCLFSSSIEKPQITLYCDHAGCKFILHYIPL